jgi:hypothetical protein
MNPDSIAQEHPKHEPSGLHTRAVLTGVAAVIAMVLLASGIATVLTRQTRAVTNRSESLPQTTSSLLTSDPSDDRAAFERQKRRRLESYGWVDQQKQLVHIPIERAMSLSIARLSTVEHPSSTADHASSVVERPSPSVEHPPSTVEQASPAVERQ